MSISEKPAGAAVERRACLRSAAEVVHDVDTDVTSGLSVQERRNA